MERTNDAQTARLDLDLTTPTCVQWESENATQTLIESDPPTRDLLFECRFDDTTTSASFAIHCPIRVKGIDAHSHALVLISPQSITSLTFKVHPTPSEGIRKRLNCSTVRLRFVLNAPVHLVAPAAAAEPVQPRKRLSAEVFNALRSLAKATTIDIYVSDRELPRVKLNAIRAAISQSLLKPFDPIFPNTLASLYGGRGGKLIDLSLPQGDASACPSDEPPAYHDLEPSPPLAIEHTSPPQKPEHLSHVARLPECNERKRPRLEESGSPDGVDARLGLTWALVVEMRDEMRGEMNKLVKRVEQLEKENKELSDELDVLRASCEKATNGVNADEVALLEVQDDLHELTERVDFLTKNGLDSDVEKTIIDEVTNRAVKNILNKSYKISVEET